MDARNFSISSDYPIDKVIYMTSGSVTISGYNYNDVTIPHGLPFTPLTTDIYSLTPSFDTSYEYNSGPVQTDPLLSSPFLYNTGSESDSTNITLRHTNNSPSSVTIYYRVYGFMPSTVNEEAAWTASVADNFVMNSDYNYTKLFDAGVTAYSDIPDSIETINHNLGYRPQVMAWSEESSVVYSRNFTSLYPDGSNDGGAIYIDENSIIFQRQFFLFNASRLHYRIYIDE